MPVLVVLNCSKNSIIEEYNLLIPENQFSSRDKIKSKEAKDHLFEDGERLIWKRKLPLSQLKKLITVALCHSRYTAYKC